MTIASLDQALAGMQIPQFFYKALGGTMVAGRPHSYFFIGGIPGAAAAPTPGLAGAALTTYAGQITFPSIGGGLTRYLARFCGAASVGGTLLLCDRLWHNSGFTITSTGAQTVNSVAWPARDANGATTGAQVLVGVEVSTTVGSGTPTLTLGYTGVVNGASQSSTGLVTSGSGSIAGTFYPIALTAGETGVASIQNFTLSATWTSGTIHLVAYRVLAALDLSTAFGGVAMDPITGGFPQLFANTVPFLVFVPSTTTTSSILGQIGYSDG